jgi:hypothetical protein
VQFWKVFCNYQSTRQFDIHYVLRVPWIPEPSRRFNLLFTVEGSGIQGILRATSCKLGLFATRNLSQAWCILCMIGLLTFSLQKGEELYAKSVP